MSSIISGYEYDIFISYRQNDNRSGWVTEFVHHLNEELAATIKEPVSVYFDANPHDGLLETHNVDKSLERKLKCLIFIPILSQTYCDTRSFAWQQEFCAFNLMAQDDAFGMDIVLPNGNVASRILPIKIHDLDDDDKRTIEKEIGGALRSIDFIFKSAGVNRPLAAHEDHPNDNQIKTYYRDQINKVALAVKELIQGIKNPIQESDDEDTDAAQADQLKQRRKILVFAVIIIALLFGYYAYQKVIAFKSQAALSNSVAVLAFSDLSPNKDHEWFSDGLTDEILNSLANLRNLKVTARTSSFYFKGKNVPIPEIAKMLGVANVLEGTVKTAGDKIRVTAQLIRAEDGFHIWSKTYDHDSKDLLAIQIDIAENIGKALLNELSPDDKAKFAAGQTVNARAKEFYLKGSYLHDRYRTSLKLDDFTNAESELRQSISADPTYVEAYAELANLYDTYGEKNNTQKWSLRDSVIKIAESIDRHHPSVVKVKYVIFDKAGLIDSMMSCATEAFTKMPDDPVFHCYLGSLHAIMGSFDISHKFFAHAEEIDPLSTTPYPRIVDINLWWSHYDSVAAKNAIEKGLAIDPDNTTLQMQKMRGFKERNLALLLKEKEFREKMGLSPSNNVNASILALQGKREEALRSAKNGATYFRLKDKEGLIHHLDSLQKVRHFDITFVIAPWIRDFVKDDARYKTLEKLGEEKRKKFAARYGNLKWPGIN